MTMCPVCGAQKERLAQHWAMSGCGYPEIDRDQRELLDGLLLSGATVAGNGTNRHLTIGTTIPELARWVEDKLKWMHHGTRRRAEEHADVYRIRTPAHPACNRYERWTDEDRSPPSSYHLSPHAGRVWWAFAGGLQWTGPYDGQRTALISAKSDIRAAWVSRVLATAGVEGTRVGDRIQWSGEGLRRWLDYIGPPVPGVEYKWCDSLIEYRVQRATPGTEVAEQVKRAQLALEIASQRTEQELTPALFDERVDVIAADAVADLLGGGSWADAVSTAGVRAAASAARPERKSGGRNPPEWGPANKRPRDDFAMAMQAAAKEMGEPLTRQMYQDWRDEHPDAPAAGTYQSRFDGWVAAGNKFGVETRGRSRKVTWTTERVRSALAEWLDEHNGSATTTEYREYQAGREDHPSLSTVYRVYDSWADALAAAEGAGADE